MIRRQYTFGNSLEHHGRKGMHWYKHIFGEVQEQAKYASKLGKEAAKNAAEKSKDGKVSDNKKDYSGYDVSEETKKLAAGDTTKKSETETKTTKAASSGSETDATKEEKTEEEKLKEKIEQLEQQIANLKSQKSSGGGGGGSRGGSSGGQKASSGEGLSGKKQEGIALTGGLTSAEKQKKNYEKVLARLKAEKAAKEGISLTDKKDKTNKTKTKETDTKETEDSKKEDVVEFDDEPSAKEIRNLLKKQEATYQEKLDSYQKLVTETGNKTNALEEQLKKSQERIDAFEELLKKYNK